jgi:signal transduction histidine kinase/ligand-binding sensor domain-containing protein
MLRRFLPLFLIVWLQAAPAAAIDPTRYITQYAHTAWRMQDGALNSTPWTIVQTPEGYIWVGTADGILQFDGVHFGRWMPGNGQQLPNSEVLRLRRTRDGSVWISALGVLSRWKGKMLKNYATGSRAGPDALAEDIDGKVWLAKASAPPGANALCRVGDNDLECLGAAEGLPSFHANASLGDRDGTLWVGGDTLLMHWAHGAPTFYRPPGLAANVGTIGIYALAPSTDGGVWVGIGKAGPGLGLQRIVNGRWQSFDTPAFHGSSVAVLSLYADREGALWVGTYERGIYRIHGEVVDHFDHTNGLSGDYINDIAEDSEGNLWVVTSQGVDRFADTPVASMSVGEGLCSTESASVLASRDGSIWAGGDGALTRLYNGRTTCFRKGHELPGSQVTSLFEDHAGRLWVGLDQGLWVYERGQFHQVTRMDSRPIGLVTGIAEDTEQRVWITGAGPPRILMRVENLRVREDVLEPPVPRRVVADPTGGLWLGLFNGDLAHLRDGRAIVHAFKHPEGTLINQLFPEADGSIIAATSSGLIGWRNGKALTLTQRNGLPCEQVYAIAFDERGDLWLYMNCALGVLARADFLAWKQNPDIAVTIRTLDALDGVRPSPAAFVAAARSLDGRLWFANSVSLQFVDTKHLRQNTVPPPVYIEQVIADRTAYPAQGILQLPPRTRDLEIDYVGLSFVAPQKVRFRYRLHGRDDVWQEPGTRRQAFYNDLRPGQYSFQVIASNNDGVWNDVGASLSLVVSPAWYQTKLFLAGCFVSAALLLLLLHRLRMSHAVSDLNARFDERLAERTRIAREFHDTLLQTIEGSKLVADDALDQPADPARMRRAVEQLSEWLSRAIQEGRAALQSLRTSTTETNDLAEGLRRATDECRMFSPMKTSLRVQGEAREMHPVVRDEVYRIVYEAIRNACVHSKASELAVELKYAQDLSISVSDNGIGIPQLLISQGKNGHYGLQGMRERADRIGGKLKVTSSANSGTEITIVIPGRIVFLRPDKNPIQKIASIFRVPR